MWIMMMIFQNVLEHVILIYYRRARGFNGIWIDIMAFGYIACNTSHERHITTNTLKSVGTWKIDSSFRKRLTVFVIACIQNTYVLKIMIDNSPEYMSSSSMARLGSSLSPRTPILLRTVAHKRPSDNAIFPFCTRLIESVVSCSWVKLNYGRAPLTDSNLGLAQKRQDADRRSIRLVWDRSWPVPRWAETIA